MSAKNGKKILKRNFLHKNKTSNHVYEIHLFICNLYFKSTQSHLCEKYYHIIIKIILN